MQMLLVVVWALLPELVELVNKHDLVKLTMKKFKKKMLRKGIWLLLVPMILKSIKGFMIYEKRYLICNIADTTPLVIIICGT
jgi:precorrin-2 dehydrogenase/sirohydrochlorin ferrochelatase